MRTETKKRYWAPLLLAAMLTPQVSSSATLIVDGNGILTGAQGVEVIGNFYDVVFRDGTFGEIFGNPPDYNCNADGLASCKATANWDASTYGPSAGDPGSDAFANALLAQVFIDGPQGMFDSNPGLIAGCENTNTFACIVATPNERNTFGQTTLSGIFNGRAVNYDSSGVGTDGTDRQNFGVTMDLSDFSGAVWADWSPAAVVPVPAAIWLFGSALVGLGWMRRKQTA